MNWDFDKPKNPLLQKDPLTGLYPGQATEGDIPDFLRRVPGRPQPEACQVQTEPSWSPPWSTTQEG